MAARTRIYGPDEEVLAIRTDSGWADGTGFVSVFCQQVEYQVDDDFPARCSMLEFVDANGELDDCDLWDVLTGGTVVLGGGAAPLVRVTGVRS